MSNEPKGKRPRGRPRQRWVDNITRNLRELLTPDDWQGQTRMERSRWQISFFVFFFLLFFSFFLSFTSFNFIVFM